MASQSYPPVPPGIGKEARKIWIGVLSRFDLDEREMAVLAEAVRAKTRLDDLDAMIQRDGMVDEYGRVTPVAKEARALGIAFLRMMADLRMPDEEGNRPQHRGTSRGTYIKGVS